VDGELKGDEKQGTRVDDGDGNEEHDEESEAMISSIEEEESDVMLSETGRRLARNEDFERDGVVSSFGSEIVSEIDEEDWKRGKPPGSIWTGFSQDSQLARAESGTGKHLGDPTGTCTLGFESEVSSSLLGLEVILSG